MQLICGCRYCVMTTHLSICLTCVRCIKNNNSTQIGEKAPYTGPNYKYTCISNLCGIVYSWNICAKAGHCWKIILIQFIHWSTELVICQINCQLQVTQTHLLSCQIHPDVCPQPLTIMTGSFKKLLQSYLFPQTKNMCFKHEWWLTGHIMSFSCHLKFLSMYPSIRKSLIFIYQRRKSTSLLNYI